MKKLKSFIALIALVFITGTTLIAGDCFDMNMNIEHEYFRGKWRVIVDIEVINHSGQSVTVTDTMGRMKTCSGSCTFTWSYTFILPQNNDFYIECASGGGCVQQDGCTIVIDPT